MAWQRSSTVQQLPADPVGDAAAESISEILRAAVVDLVYWPADGTPPSIPGEPATATASGDGPSGWRMSYRVRLGRPITALVTSDSTRLTEILRALPGAALRAAARFRSSDGAAAPQALSPAIRRALRDTMVIELLADHHAHRGGGDVTGLIAETVEYLVELSGSRVESHQLTHGVLIADVFDDTPRLRFEYPADLRAAKRAPLLFDGQRSVLIVDTHGHPRSELQRHRLDRLPTGAAPGTPAAEFVESGSLVAEATRRLGGLGFFLRADRTIWVFIDGQPFVLRRSEHWTAFPVELTAFIARLIGGGRAASIVVQAAYILSAQGRGAILAVVEDRDSLDGIVSAKDRYDRRDEVDLAGMRPETRLHHLIDTKDLDSQTLARLAGLDGATIVDRDANLLSYGAIVTSSDSQHEGARTAAAKTLSQTADVVLKVSQDGDITVFHAGEVAATLLGQSPEG